MSRLVSGKRDLAVGALVTLATVLDVIYMSTVPRIVAVLLLAAWSAVTASGHWLRAEIYRLGDVPDGEERQAVSS